MADPTLRDDLGEILGKSVLERELLVLRVTTKADSPDEVPPSHRRTLALRSALR